ncbi:hypothetical protein AB205_0205390 [Aquarana catesbeiana]|uniref:Uncharacterized protein n=1 Tax=Aquarana catesbeiana TaxID=8400 RepID=A0A2G9NKZ4_AQUCT|nr:hypothetical protein AB205_0205390 [Aquarana catesbeiana]
MSWSPFETHICICASILKEIVKSLLVCTALNVLLLGGTIFLVNQYLYTFYAQRCPITPMVFMQQDLGVSINSQDFLYRLIHFCHFKEKYLLVLPENQCPSHFLLTKMKSQTRLSSFQAVFCKLSTPPPLL